MFCVRQEDILDVYREEGKLREYNMCNDYLRLTNIEEKEISKDTACNFCVDYPILLKWKNGKSCPSGIKALRFLKERNLLPYHPNERTAKIIGFLHGDGYLNYDLGAIGFISKDKNMILRLKEDVEKEFGIDGKFKKKRDIGCIEVIHGKQFVVKNPTYQVTFTNKALGCLIFKLGVPRGKKIFQETFVPSWIMNENKEIQKGFLQGIFDSELSNASISTFKRHKDNLSSPRMEMGKIKSLENNLKVYLLQIRALLKNWGIDSKIIYPREYRLGRISLTLSICNKLSNLYNFVERIGFYYNTQRKDRSLVVQKLALQKIKDKSILFDILNFCKDKDSFTLKEIEKDLKMSCSYSKIIGLYIYNNKFADRVRREDRWFEYYPHHSRIQKILENPLLLEKLPKPNIK